MPTAAQFHPIPPVSTPHTKFHGRLRTTCLHLSLSPNPFPRYFCISGNVAHLIQKDAYDTDFADGLICNAAYQIISTVVLERISDPSAGPFNATLSSPQILVDGHYPRKRRAGRFDGD